MAYYSPFIDSTGLHIPNYVDIRDSLIAEMRSIFGQDIYLDEDSQDYQQISIFAKKIYDTNALAVLVYNNRTANTAVGIGLDNLCALVGITRKPATYSTVTLTITGEPGTIIYNGQASDGTNVWDLPEEVEIPDNGIVDAIAQCHVAGNIQALAGTINEIATPTYGWNSVTNNYSAAPGLNVETDMELRGRYANATLLPSTSIFEGIVSAVENVEGVTKVKAYENDTGTTDANGIPAHSICFVVEGGEDDQIAWAICAKKTPGCGTYGTTTIPVVSLGGISTNINFYRPTDVDIYLNVAITALAGYSPQCEEDIKASLVDYINNLDISSEIYMTALLSVAMQAMVNLDNPAYTVTNIEGSTDGVTFSSSDITIAFNELPKITEANIQVVVS